MYQLLIAVTNLYRFVIKYDTSVKIIVEYKIDNEVCIVYYKIFNTNIFIPNILSNIETIPFALIHINYLENTLTCTRFDDTKFNVLLKRCHNTWPIPSTKNENESTRRHLSRLGLLDVYNTENNTHS